MTPDNTHLIVILIIAGIIALILQLWMEARRKPREHPQKILALIKCSKCGYTIEKNFEPGDFVGLIKGKCPKCGSNMRIDGVYSIEIKRQQRKT